MKFLTGVLVGLFVGLVLWGSARDAQAQAPSRMFGTLSTGASKLILVDSSGAVQVKAQ